MRAIETIPVNVTTLSSEQGESLLSQRHHMKTLDVGHDGNTVSTNHLGDMLQLSCFHPFHGIVVACPFAQFDGERFYDSEYVRRYRTTLLDYVRASERGFGIHFTGTASNVNVELEAGKRILVTYSIGDIHVEMAISVGENGQVIQSAVLKSTSTRSVKVDYTLVLNISVNRASYGQLTEGGPVPIPLPKNDLRLYDDGRVWTIVNPNLDAIIQGTLYCDGLPLRLRLDTECSRRISPELPVDAAFRRTLSLSPNQTRTLTSVLHLRPGTALSKAATAPKNLSLRQEDRWKIGNESMRLIVKGNLAYILGNCTVPVGDDCTCFITDHIALPLGWNRDNYWQIRYLLDVHRGLDRLLERPDAQRYHIKIQTVVRQHLNWVFRRAKRPYGYWHRSYLTTGVPKDGPVFQQDQQCYPILELCDFFDHFPSESEFVASILDHDAISSVLSVLASHRDGCTGLYMTEETPGDDAVEHPFHFSSHILLWHTFTSLARLLSAIGFKSNSLNSDQLQVQASQIRKSILKHFVATNPATGTSMYAYLTDGAGIHTFYHDANDLPTLFIPTWNFASPSSPEYALWIRTMEFALSPLNIDGFFPEDLYGGLGSVHTRGPWPLGFAQEYIYANIIGDGYAARDAWRRIQGSMFWDGLFSEAVDAQTGDCTSKAWFSWPGSMIGSALLKYGVPMTK